MDQFENYEVTSIIGSGSFGTCYKVKYKNSSKEFVWKAVNYRRMSEEKKQLLVSEVNLLSKLKHPNIVKYHNHIIHRKSSTLYIITEYCSGGDLSKLINNCLVTKRYLNELFIWRILYQISLALDVCHTQCSVTVLHRDIKPANVFLDSDNNVKLGDFGLAKILDEKQNFTATVVGTPMYMSPELIRHKKYDNKSDIWALGCLIYEACALKPPFDAFNLNHLNEQIKEGKFQSIPNHYSNDLHKMINYLLTLKSEFRPTVDVILTHPTVLLKSNKPFENLYEDKTKPEQELNLNSQIESKFEENLQIRLEALRIKESELKIKEETLNTMERNLIKREKKLVTLEKLANDKLLRANLHLKRMTKPKLKPVEEDLNSTYSADPGDTSILPTSTKILEENIIKPKGFVRSKSERRVHFNARRVFESTDDLVLKEYNFFNNNEFNSNEIKSKKKHGFRTVFKALSTKSVSSSGSKSSSSNSELIHQPLSWNEENIKISSSSSLDTKSSNTSKFVSLSHSHRPVSWTEENKKCAFTLLKLMNVDNEKENLHSNIIHTKL